MNASSNNDLTAGRLLARADTRCRMCGGLAHFEREVWDDRYGYPGRFAVTRCMSCNHIAVQVDMNASQIAALYTNYYPRSTFSVDAWQIPAELPPLTSWWRGAMASAFRWVPRDVRVLDIGCGFGESLGYHRNRGCDAHGVEADENILRVAARHGLNVRVGLFDAAVYAPASFDVVTLDQVIEHVTDPKALLQGVAQVLKPGGTLILSTPNAQGWGARVFGRRWIHWHAPYHQQFFSLTSMQRATADAGLVLESTRTVTNSAWLGFQWCHLASGVDEGQKAAFWNRSAPRTAWQRLVFRASAVLDRLGVNAVITRVFDALCLGDNRVFVLRKVAS